jgi:hypothetical protein
VTSGAERGCKHNDFTDTLITHVSTPPRSLGERGRAQTRHTATQDAFLTAVQEQWPGLQGKWGIERARGRIKNDSYEVILVRLETGNGDTVSSVVAFCDRHTFSQERWLSGVAWVGYALAHEVARLGGQELTVPSPGYYRHRGGRRQAERRTGATLTLRDLARTNTSAAMRPEQRAEQLLVTYLGPLYGRLEAQGFLDISSRLYRGRVYRLRRDPEKRYERRVRVFENGRYVRDLCIVRDDYWQRCPEGDWYLTVYLRLLSDEAGILSVVGPENVFRCHSDGFVDETLPAVWQPEPRRAALSAS